MKKLFTTAFILSISTMLTQAQDNSAKLDLSKGLKIKMKSIDTSLMKNKMGENDMEMKTYSASTTEVELIDVNKDKYTATSSLKQIMINFEGYGQKMKYDSESKEKQEGMMADEIKKSLNKADTIFFSNTGETIKKEDKKEGGMMQMMSQGGANIENAFLLVPADAKEGNGWKKDKKDDELRTQTIYFIEKINGNIVEVSFKRKTKGIAKVKGGQMGGDMNVDIDNLSSGTITVDKSTGLVKSYNETINTNSKMNVMNQDMQSTGTVSTHVVFE